MFLIRVGKKTCFVLFFFDLQYMGHIKWSNCGFQMHCERVKPNIVLRHTEGKDREKRVLVIDYS